MKKVAEDYVEKNGKAFVLQFLGKEVKLQNKIQQSNSQNDDMESDDDKKQKKTLKQSLGKHGGNFRR